MTTPTRNTVQGRATPLKNTSGFTLIELLVSVGIFAIVMLMAVSSLLSLVDLDRKAQSMKSVMNNLNFAMESMSREIKVGTDFSSPDIYTFTYQDHANNQVTYSLPGEQILRSVNSGPDVALTAPEVVIQNRSLGIPLFSLVGEIPKSVGDTQQPYVLIRIKGNVKISEKIQSSFSIQTTASQRLLDL